MVYFSQRRKLAKAFDDWRKKSGTNGHNVTASCPENVIAFLDAKGLLNEEKTKEFLKKIENKN